MKFLLFFVIVLITYGSLYPFDFEVPGIETNDFQLFLATWSEMTHRGDILANIVLFTPLGFIGVHALDGKKEYVVLNVLLLGLALGVILQFVQIYLPSRDPSFTDAIWNFLGTVIGISISHFWRSSITISRLSLDSSLTAPMLLVASWLGYRLMPFIPTIDWAQYKNSVKPLFLHPEFSWVGFFHDSVAWAIVCLIFLTILPKRNIVMFIFLGLPGVFFLEVIIIENVVSLTNVTGAVVGVGIGWMLKKFVSQPTSILALLLIVFLIVNGLTPFNIRLAPNTFHWIPFYGFLGESMLLNTSVLFEKLFLYGALLWLLTQSGLTIKTAIAIGFIVTFSIEIAQISFGLHTAEITDPLLIVMLGVGMSVFESEQNNLIAVPTNGSTRYTIKLKPAATLLSNQLPIEGIDVNSMPFRIGRFDGQAENPAHIANQISFSDYAPFQLSRNHFSIEQGPNGMIIRDSGSRLGTIVNGVQIGAAVTESDLAFLNIGSNKIVAGGPMSKFRFDVVVEVV
jgi:VanZ family protein